jgi:pimeloyl-ACP methyl ester carboxylesterase
MLSLARSSLLPLLLAAVIGCTRAPETHPIDRFFGVDVGGHRLHLLALGQRHQDPAVILESGAGAGIGWDHVRNQIAQFTQVITYDRAGIGQSQPGPQPRDARMVAGELHAALHQANVPPPYLLVGQSLGGLYVQVFAAMFPDETAGLVLVDPTHASADLCLSAEDVKVWFTDHDPDDWPRVESACASAPDGLRSYLACKYKLMETYIETVPGPRHEALRRQWWAMIDTLIGQNPQWQSTGGAHQEAIAMADSIRQAIAARPLPNVPIILLAASKIDLDALPPDALTPDAHALQGEARRWNMAEFHKFVDNTPGAKLVVVDGSGHNIETDRPDAIIAAVREALR